VLVTVSSIGAGAIGATLLVMLYPKLSPAEVAGTDIAYAVPLTAIAAAGHWWLGSIDWMLLLTLLIGSVPGITLGSWAARKVPEALPARPAGADADRRRLQAGVLREAS
jgi:uncharacterized membrane protein YfcA